MRLPCCAARESKQDTHLVIQLYQAFQASEMSRLTCYMVMSPISPAEFVLREDFRVLSHSLSMGGRDRCVCDDDSWQLQISVIFS